MTGLLVFWALIFAWVGAGCVAQTMPTVVAPASEPKIVPSVTWTETPLPTSTVKPTITSTVDRKAVYLTGVPATGTVRVIQETSLALTPSPTLTPSQTPTPMPQLVWADWVGRPTRVERGWVIWSPTENRFLVNDCLMGEMGLLFLSEAPDFELVSITPDEFQCSLASRDVSWNPTGEFFVYTGVPKNGFQGEYTDMWMMDRDGKNPRRVNPEGEVGWHMWPEFPWMDDQTFVDITYYGGGNIYVDIINIITGKHISSAAFHGEEYPSNADYIPADSDGTVDLTILFVISKTPQPQVFPDWMVSSTYARPFPILGWSMEDLVNSIFEDWLVDTNKMLVYWQRIKNQVEETPQLSLWNVDTDEVTTLAPNGVGGRFSPDGSTLAYITVGSPNLDEIGHPVLNEQWPSAETQTYLQLMKMDSQQVFLSLPTYQSIDEWTFVGVHYFPEFSFSPNSRYLAFQTFGTLQLDPAGWPVGVNDSDILYLHILDLTTQKVIFTSEITTTSFQNLSWSPLSDKLLYRDPQQNLQIFFLENQTLQPITENAGELIRNLAWSYDGHYLSMSVEEDGEYFFDYTAIIHLP